MLVADGIRWSPDGREIAFAVLQAGNRDIYTLSIEGGSPRRLTSEPSDEGRPSYSMDGQSLYFRSNRSGREEIWKMPRQGGTPVQMTRDGGFEAVESLDGKTLYFIRARGQSGLWSMPVAGGDVHPVAGLEAAPRGRWDVTADGVCYLANDTSSPHSRRHAHPRPGANEWRCRSSAGTPTPGSPGRWRSWTSPCGRCHRCCRSRATARAYWSQADSREADLVLIENFR